MDCSKDRLIQVANKAVFVPKNYLYTVQTFKGFTVGMASYVLVFEWFNNTEESFMSFCEHMKFLEISDTQKIEQIEIPNSKYFTYAKSKLEVGRKYQLLYAYNHMYDTIERGPICAPGLGWNLLAFAELGDTFKEICPELVGSCDCDTNMYGQFMDSMTGEELLISKAPFTVKYRSKKSLNWQTLFIHSQNPGEVNVSFTKIIQNWETDLYKLWFTGETWILPAKRSYTSGEVIAPAQFFRKVKK